MKKIILLLILTCTTSISFSQTHEIGFFLGGTNYIGDIGSTTYLNPNDIGGGIIYKYNLNPRIALRGTFSRFSISGDDAKSDNDFRVNRETPSISFSNDITELAVGIEFNFFDYNNGKPNTQYTPYILVEFANFFYDTIEDLSTTSTIYENNSSYSIPVGIGFKGHISHHIAFAIESAIRFTFVDDIDYTTPDIPELDFGSYNNDFYVFTGVSLVYTFGRPACYATRE